MRLLITPVSFVIRLTDSLNDYDRSSGSAAPGAFPQPFPKGGHHLLSRITQQKIETPEAIVCTTNAIPSPMIWERFISVKEKPSTRLFVNIGMTSPTRVDTTFSKMAPISSSIGGFVSFNSRKKACEPALLLPACLPELFPVSKYGPFLSSFSLPFHPCLLSVRKE